VSRKTRARVCGARAVTRTMTKGDRVEGRFEIFIHPVGYRGSTPRDG